MHEPFDRNRASKQVWLRFGIPALVAIAALLSFEFFQADRDFGVVLFVSLVFMIGTLWWIRRSLRLARNGVEVTGRIIGRGVTKYGMRNYRVVYEFRGAIYRGRFSGPSDMTDSDVSLIVDPANPWRFAPKCDIV